MRSVLAKIFLETGNIWTSLRSSIVTNVTDAGTISYPQAQYLPFCIFIGGLDCVGYSYACVAHI